MGRFAAIDHLRDRIVEIRTAPERVAKIAAPMIERKLKSDATTKRGNVPAYGKFGDVPIVASARPEAIVVSAPDFVMKKAHELGQVDEWVDIITDVAEKEMAGNR